MEIAYVGLGSNLGNSVPIIRRAMERLQAFSVRPVVKSSLWETSPVDCPPGSRNFVNAAIGLAPQTGETPETLLQKLQQLEQAFGRQSKRRLNEPRPLDLDLIAFGRQRRSTSELTLPHPRAHLRRFVLAPLNEIAPDLRLPGCNRPIRGLLENLESDEVVRLISDLRIA